MTLVVDASVVVAALADSGPTGSWAEAQILRGPLVAPHLLPAEVANILRKTSIGRGLTTEVATQAYSDFLALPIELVPYALFADRIWELKHTVSAYDAWYVALAESLDAPLATLDARLARSPGPRCEFVVPDTASDGKAPP